MKKLFWGLGLVVGLMSLGNADWECHEEVNQKILAGESESIYFFPNSEGWHGMEFSQYNISSVRASTYDISWTSTEYGLSAYDWEPIIEGEGIATSSNWKFFYAGSKDIAFKIVFHAQDKYDMPISYGQRWTSVNVEYKLCQNGME